MRATLAYTSRPKPLADEIERRGAMAKSWLAFSCYAFFLLVHDHDTKKKLQRLSTIIFFIELVTGDS